MGICSTGLYHLQSIFCANDVVIQNHFRGCHRHSQGKWIDQLPDTRGGRRSLFIRLQHPQIKSIIRAMIHRVFIGVAAINALPGDIFDINFNLHLISFSMAATAEQG